MGKDNSGGESGDNPAGDSGNKSSADSGSKPVDARVARRRQDPIGRRLRQMYDEVVNEDVPDDFLSFLEKADERMSEGPDTDPIKSARIPRPVKTEP